MGKYSWQLTAGSNEDQGLGSRHFGILPFGLHPSGGLPISEFGFQIATQLIAAKSRSHSNKK
jgi:hypothetical protein